MARPPRLAITVGIAVATAVDSIAPRKRPSITPKMTSPRRGGALGHGALPRGAGGALGARASAGAARVREHGLVPVLPLTRRPPASRRISVGQASGGRRAGAARAGRAQEGEGVDAPVPVLPRHAERVASDEGHGLGPVRVGADQREQGSRHGAALRSGAAGAPRRGWGDPGLPGVRGEKVVGREAPVRPPGPRPPADRRRRPARAPGSTGPRPPGAPRGRRRDRRPAARGRGRGTTRRSSARARGPPSGGR